METMDLTVKGHSMIRIMVTVLRFTPITVLLHCMIMILTVIFQIHIHITMGMWILIIEHPTTPILITRVPPNLWVFTGLWKGTREIQKEKRDQRGVEGPRPKGKGPREYRHF